MPSFHDEVMMPGGMYFEDDPREERTDFSVQGSGTGEPGNPLTLVLHVTTGNATVAVCGLAPKDLARLAKWLAQVAKEKLEDSKLVG